MSAWMDGYGDRTTRIPKTKYKFRTVEVIATTEPPAPGFLVGGRRVAKGEKVRFPLGEALDLERRGKAKIVPDSEKIEDQWI